jgi:hypothetical protein
MSCSRAARACPARWMTCRHRAQADACKFWLQSRGICASLAPGTDRVVPAMKRPTKTRHPCRRCPLRGPSGRCYHTALKSGVCGDWIWYVRGGKQHRRHYTRPKDPRTPAQLRCRARLKAASRAYSRSLTQAQREACIAAGAKVRSRPRLGQSGPLTGQLYWVQQALAPGPATGQAKTAIIAAEVLQPQRVTRSTSDTHRIYTGGTPESRRLPTVSPPYPHAKKGGGKAGRWRAIQHPTSSIEPPRAALGAIILKKAVEIGGR